MQKINTATFKKITLECHERTKNVIIYCMKKVDEKSYWKINEKVVKKSLEKSCQKSF